MRLVTDVMLGRLSRWLRVLGYDTRSGLVEDDDLLEVADSESRTLVTRDRSLSARAEKMGIDCIHMTSQHLEKQLIEFFTHLGEKRVKLDPKRARCPVCNGELEEVSREELTDELPPKVLEYHSEFWRCTDCLKTYWMGRHWENIEKKINHANSLLNTGFGTDAA
jgi:uncharacterized protein with PIN domain